MLHDLPVFSESTAGLSKSLSVLLSVFAEVHETSARAISLWNDLIRCWSRRTRDRETRSEIARHSEHVARADKPHASALAEVHKYSYDRWTRCDVVSFFRLPSRSSSVSWPVAGVLLTARYFRFLVANAETALCFKLEGISRFKYDFLMLRTLFLYIYIFFYTFKFYFINLVVTFISKVKYA